MNTEHQLKLDELTNDDQRPVQLPVLHHDRILFVDSNLNIRKFTEYVGGNSS